jgi:CheY-like chemotaxis protein
MTKVLLIENDPAILGNLARLLRLEGFHVALASNGEQGLSIVRSEPPDIVVCDLVMPGMSGDEVLAALRADPATRDLPFLFLTASADESQREAKLRSGASDYLIKPIESRALLAAIRQHVPQ